MNVFSTETFVRVFATAFDRFSWWLGRYQAIAAIPNQFTAIGRSQRIANLEIVFRLEKLHEGAL